MRRGSALDELGIIYDGALLISGGVLQEVGPTRRVENLALARGAIEIDATGCVVIPGFVDCHTHLLYPPLHPPAPYENRPFDLDACRTVQNATVGRLEHRARAALDDMARHGTTTIEVKAGCGCGDACDMKLLCVTAALDRHPLELNPSLVVGLDRLTPSNPDALERLERLCRDLLPKVQRRRLARFVDLHGAQGPDLGPAGERVVAVARAHGLHIRMHAPACLSAGIKAGAVSVSHLDDITDEDIAMLASSDTAAVLVPAASFHEARGRYGPGRRLIDRGAAVALGSNFNSCHFPTLSMPAVIALACSRMHLTPAEAVAAATINAAHALRRGDRLGSLEYGKVADLTVLDIADYRELGRHIGNNAVTAVVKGGEVIYERGEVAGNKLPTVA
jgi:imidazolonepropionase